MGTTVNGGQCAVNTHEFVMKIRNRVRLKDGQYNKLIRRECPANLNRFGRYSSMYRRTGLESGELLSSGGFKGSNEADNILR